MNVQASGIVLEPVLSGNSASTYRPSQLTNFLSESLRETRKSISVAAFPAASNQARASPYEDFRYLCVGNRANLAQPT